MTKGTRDTVSAMGAHPVAGCHAIQPSLMLCTKPRMPCPPVLPLDTPTHPSIPKKNFTLGKFSRDQQESFLPSLGAPTGCLMIHSWVSLSLPVELLEARGPV